MSVAIVFLTCLSLGGLKECSLGTERGCENYHSGLGETMHRTHQELKEAREALESALNEGGVQWDNLFAILIDMLEDIENLQFGGKD